MFFDEAEGPSSRRAGTFVMTIAGLFVLRSSSRRARSSTRR
jgi:hypothetical protein